jgi:peptide-methionine (S)-S-oxide reductase
MFWSKPIPVMPKPSDILPGRATPMPIVAPHEVLGVSIQPPFPAGSRTIQFGMGCFWGAERKFWSLQGVLVTAVGYSGGTTPNPTYREVCSGLTGHTEAVLVVYDPAVVSLGALLKCFWESHDPTQGMRQGNDVGTQYRSVIYADDEADLAEARASARLYGEALAARGYPPITTEFALGQVFYYAEVEHQQYLAKNPNGYCGLGGTGVTCAIGTSVPLAST